jgi:hypothetical protein
MKRFDPDRLRAARRTFLRRGATLGAAAVAAGPLGELLALAGQPRAAGSSTGCNGP